MLNFDKTMKWNVMHATCVYTSPSVLVKSEKSLEKLR